MPLQNPPLAIDGALTSSSLIRKGIRAAAGGPGVAGPNDFKVSASSPAGQSLRVSPGLALVDNGYESTPDEVYVVPNPSILTVGSSSMPGSSGSTTYWLVCVVVGDPAYDQTGHPYMPSDFDEDQADTYEYSRIVVLPCTSTTDSFDDLGKSYPGLALARLALPASTTTVTDGMLTDLRVRAGHTEVRRWDAVSTANVTWTNSEGQKDVTGATVVVTSTSVNDVFDVDISADVYCTGAVANFTDLMVDGVGKGDSVIAEFAAHNNGHGMWTVTGLTPGPHTFKVVSSMFAGSAGTALHSAGTTKLRIRRVD